MPKRIRKYAIPSSVTLFGPLFAGEGDTGGGGAKPADDAKPAGDGDTGKPDDAKDATKGDLKPNGEADKLEGQKRVNRDLENKLNQMRDGLKAALGIDDKKATVEDLVSSLKDEIGGLRRENMVEKVARRHKITDDEDLILLQSATDEQSMEKLAVRLAPKGEAVGSTSGKPGSKPKPDSSQGQGGGGDTGSRPSSVAEVMEQRRAEREKRQTKSA